MIQVDLPPPGTAATALARSMTACLASVTETSPHALHHEPDAQLDDVVRTWRTHLAARGLGLAEVAHPTGVTMPGYWIAVLTATDLSPRIAVLMFGTPPGAVLSPARTDLLGRAAADLPVERAFVLVALDPAAPAPTRHHAAPLRGHVTTIAIARRATAPMEVLTRARALAGRGLAGDRYARHAGTFTPTQRTTGGYDLTLIEAEAVDALAGGGVQVDHAQARRNLVTRGIDLNALVGRRFRVGDVECLGRRLCEPCIHLEHLTTPGVLRALVHRGGLRADVLTDGTISTGDTIEVMDGSQGSPAPAPGWPRRGPSREVVR